MVYKVDYEYQAKGNEDKWFFVDKEYQSEYNVYFVDYAYQADLKICFVSSEYKAGWKEKSKIHLLYGKKK